jgi:hypothetical protein
VKQAGREKKGTLIACRIAEVIGTGDCWYDIGKVPSGIGRSCTTPCFTLSTLLAASNTSRSLSFDYAPLYGSAKQTMNCKDCSCILSFNMLSLLALRLPNPIYICFLAISNPTKTRAIVVGKVSITYETNSVLDLHFAQHYVLEAGT